MIEIGNMYRPNRGGSWSKDVFIPLKIIDYTGDTFWLKSLSDNGRKKIVVGAIFHDNESNYFLHLNGLKIDAFPIDIEFPKVRNKQNVLSKLFYQIFSNECSGLDNTNNLLSL